MIQVSYAALDSLYQLCKNVLDFGKVQFGNLKKKKKKNFAELHISYHCSDTLVIAVH